MGELIGVARFDFRDGDVEEFKRLSAQCMEIVRAKEPGTLQYEVFFNADESEAMVIERYRDEDAAKAHAQNISPFMDAVTATGSVHGELLGDVSDELRSNLEGGPVQLFTPYLSM